MSEHGLTILPAGRNRRGSFGLCKCGWRSGTVHFREAIDPMYREHLTQVEDAAQTDPERVER